MSPSCEQFLEFCILFISCVFRLMLNSVPECPAGVCDVAQLMKSNRKSFFLKQHIPQADYRKHVYRANKIAESTQVTFELWLLSIS